MRDINKQVSGEHPEYDILLNISHIHKNVDHRLNHLFVIENCLSLDKYPVRIFGRMKFEVKIIIKPELYGIKIYVAMDAYNTFVTKYTA